MPRKVGFVRKLKASSLVEFCPFCGDVIDGKSHVCSQAKTLKSGMRLPDAAYCPLCRNEIEPGGHECPA